jgi:hypothetical protein
MLFDLEHCPVHGNGHQPHHLPQPTQPSQPMLQSLVNMQQQIHHLNAQLNNVQAIAMERRMHPQAPITAIHSIPVSSAHSAAALMNASVVAQSIPIAHQPMSRSFNPQQITTRSVTSQGQLVPILTTNSASNHLHPNQAAAQADAAKQMNGATLLPLPLHPSVSGRLAAQQMLSNRAFLLPGCLAPAAAGLLSCGLPARSQKLVQMLDPANGADACCKGHLIALWLILALVILGLVSCIILGITVN